MSHRRFITVAASVAALLLLPAGIATAGQWPHERDGVVLGVNLGGGSAGVNILGFDLDREGGAAGNIRVGYAFQNQFALGLEGNAWTKEVDGVTWSFSVVGAAFTYYPSGQGFYVRGGIGSGKVEIKASSGSRSVTASDTGPGLLGAMGYEWRLSRTFALGPQVDYGYAKVNDDLSINYVNFTVGANFYF
jgi:hypothetical protein